MTQPHPTWLRQQLARLLRPRDRLTVSQWADAYRRLSEKSSPEPGQWRTARTPYLREIMDALSADSPVERVVVMKSAQLGVTELAVNWIGYLMDHVQTPKPTLIVLPTEKLLVRWVHQRLRPMIEGAPTLRDALNISKSRDGTNRLDLIDYPGGLLYLTTAGSASNLKSDSICYVICDEADEYDWDVEGRGDPLGLIESRQSNFPRRKLLIFSTPTVRGSSRIEGEYQASDQRRYLVPCPHCGEHQPLEWGQLQWNPDLSHVWYTCAHNGCVIEERDKPAMLRERSDLHPGGAYWSPTATTTNRPGIRGYHLNALYSPIGLGYSWWELAKQHHDAATSDELAQQFRNERLGLPWEDQRTATRAQDLRERAEPYPLRILQPGALLITAGVDTQDDRLEIQIIGWGRDRAWWVLDYHVLYGDPGRPELWVQLADYLSRPLETPSGQLVQIEATAIDQAGHHTDMVKAFIGGLIIPVRQLQRLIAIIGARYRRAQILGKPRKTDFTHSGRTLRQGATHHEVATEIAKDKLYRDLRQDAERDPSERLGHIPQDLPEGYIDGLLSEAWNPKRNRYEPRRGMTKRNEPLDTWCYAYAAAHHPTLRLDKLRANDWAMREQRLHPNSAAADPSADQSADQTDTDHPSPTAPAGPDAKPRPTPRAPQLPRGITLRR